MKLQEARVQNFKSIEDSGWVGIEEVTSLVGKNESGKTAFLEAINKVNPTDGSDEYEPLYEYPRKRYTQYNERHDTDPDPVTSLGFELSETEVEEIEEKYSEEVLKSNKIRLTKYYSNKIEWEIDIDESKVVTEIVQRYDIHTQTARSLSQSKSVAELERKSRESEATGSEFEELISQVSKINNRGIQNYIGDDILESKIPKFLYFSNYYTMEGNVYVKRLKNRKDNSNLTDSDRTFLSLLSEADIQLSEVLSLDNYEEVKAKFEASSSQITDQVFKYWSQGPHLRVEFDKSQEYHPDANRNRKDEELVLHVRIKDQNNQLTLPFDERSRGFVWFFSFLSYFSEMSKKKKDLVLLLDEPGLNLHARAQYDLLQFINDRLAPEHTVVYTTHSPFMLEPRKLERAKLVMKDELGESGGTIVSEDILDSDDDTMFPLQAALGYDLIQTLLIGPEVLLVEGKSDMTYLQVMSDILDKKGKEALSHRWTIIPLSGADNAPTFVSLFGANDLRIAVLLDEDSDVNRRIKGIENRGGTDVEDIVTVSEFSQSEEADTEDLFSNEFYQEVVNDAYLPELRMSVDAPDNIDINKIENQHPRVVNRIEWFFDKYDVNEGVFEHQKPASHLQKNKEKFESKLDDKSINRFEQLFSRMNKLLE